VIFDADALHAIVTRQLAAADVPAGHRNAFVLVATTGGGVTAVLTTKLNDVWSIEQAFSVAPGERLAGGVQVKATW